jgi:F-type H+-transporting ATPase subunit b
MLQKFIFLADAAAPAAATENPITKITQEFGISTPFLIAQIINFLLVAFILWKIAFKPIIATLDERQKKIADGLRYAEEMKAKLEAVQQESAASAKRSQADATRIIDEARKSAKEFLEKQTQETAARASDILAKAEQVIELEKKKMLAEARTEIARLVVETTQRVLSKELSDTERSRYNESAARELTNV